MFHFPSLLSLYRSASLSIYLTIICGYGFCTGSRSSSAALSRALLDAVRESSRARVTERQEILGRTQQLLNLTLVLEAYVQLITSWLGALAIVWATVVILGQFSTVLTKRDFWFTTAIVFIEATKYVTQIRFFN